MRVLPTISPGALLFGLALSLLGPAAPPAHGEDPAAESAVFDSDDVQFFEQRIRPVLVQHCYECHSAASDSIQGGLLLDTREGWQQGGDSGEPAVVPGDPEASPLLRVMRHDEPGLEMPPDGDRLSDRILVDFESWVRRGAPDPRDGRAAPRNRADKSWWSLQPLAEVPPPDGPERLAAVGDALPGDLAEAWSRHPIDRFILQRLTESGLRPSPRADRRTLIRRLSYDLTGLPPSPEQVEAFVADDDPHAYANLVDRLLASPHYGERWGRHWLDVVRFGESNGFERNFLIDTAWPFRDYVIRSFNEDKPFNQFLVEHLAGDVVGRDDPEVEVGVAFLTLGPYDDVGNQDPAAAAEIRAATVDDMVTAIGSSMLGMTIHCARCHHHKFDPLPTEDYYRIKSAVDGVVHGERALATAEQREEHRAATQPLLQERAELEKARGQRLDAIVERGKATEVEAAARPRPPASAGLTEERFDPVTARFVRLTILATTDDPAGGAGARIDEFEVWTAEEDAEEESSSRNVALASHGALATGSIGRVADDFAGAYGVDLVNDGRYGARWFVGSPPVLTIELPRPERIDRVSFSHDRIEGRDTPTPGQGPAVAEYEIEVSEDGERWQSVATSHDRQPYSEAHLRERLLRQYTEDSDRQRLSELAQEIGRIDAQLHLIPPLPNVWVGNFHQPEGPTHVFVGGDATKPGAKVSPESLSLLDHVAPNYSLSAEAPESERRLALAQWITSDENPLTARVLANRLWHYHFGTGIVDSPSDFGYLGGTPSHPELLDWLARRLQQHQWRLKPMHREIVLSETYRQSSHYREEAARVDAEARLLWRFPPRRLSAEEIRDSLLMISGQLRHRGGGPGFRLYHYKQDNVATYTPLDEHGPETYRRAVYHHNVRASVVDLLSDFDLPDNATSVPRRSSTASPLQALTLLNHRFTLDMAEALAKRVEAEAAETSWADRVARLYALCYQRPPRDTELTATVALAQTHGLAAVARALLNTNELIYVE